MPRILELSLNRLFRSRWGIAVVLGVIVVAVVGVGRIFADGNNQATLGNNSPVAAVSVDPSDDDSVLESDPPPSPSTKPGRAQPEQVAYAFASAWVDHTKVSSQAWRDRLLPNVTKDLADDLDGVDPASVPASQVIGRPELNPVSDTLVTAVVTTDTGKLTLQLVAPDGHWLVDDIDWAPA